MKNPQRNVVSMFAPWMVAAIQALASSVALCDGVNANPTVLPSNAHPYGKTYSQWSAAWWQWVFSLPVTASPQFDTADCSAGQSGEVWFLAGSFNGGIYNRNCTIPAGKALFFPVANAWADNTGCPGSACPPTSNGPAQLLAIAQSLQDTASQLNCTIDGQPVQNLANQAPYRVTAVFSYTLPNDPNNVVNWLLLNFCGAASPGCYATGGTVSPAASDGVWLMLTPLAPGSHTIHISFAGSLSLDITYHLTVLPGQSGD